MKRIVITALLFNLTWLAEAQTKKNMEQQQKDSLSIAQALKTNYLQAIYEGNVEALRQLFHPGALLFGDIKGHPYFKTLEQYLEGVKNRQSPKDSGKPYEGEILSIKVVNTIAVAEVKLKMYDYEYHDILSLHKLEGKWLLVNKMLTDVKE